ncbi:hypothetical protein FV219_05795 [Methylobacterium sp. WL122]|nr:hypothetical protein FV219_05795 [Methylobacterium sp. WL122]
MIASVTSAGSRWRREIASFAPVADMSRITQGWVAPSGQTIVAGIITALRRPPERFSDGAGTRLRWLPALAGSDPAFASMPRCSPRVRDPSGGFCPGPMLS